MSERIAPVQASDHAPSVQVAAPAKTKVDEAKLKKAASEFEAILVRQLLTTAKMTGKENAYAGMAVDAFATAVTEGRGLGLALQIQRALEGMHPKTNAAPFPPPLLHPPDALTETADIEKHRGIDSKKK